MFKLSIVIPTLNEEGYIPLLLTDIKNQTVTPHEVIVVDGTSSDKTSEIVKSFGFATLVTMPPHVAKQRNRGFTVSSGDFIVFLDADNRLGVHFVEQIQNYLTRSRAQLLIPFYLPATRNPILLLGFYFFNGIFWLLHKPLPSGAGMCIVVSKDSLLRYGGFKEELKFDDIELIRRIGHRVKNIHRYLDFRVSVRRFEKYGVVRMLVTYLVLSVLFTFHLWKLANYVSYEFGKFKK